MIWILYMLECSDNSIYTGITNNIEKRIKMHESGKGAKYLRGRLPIKLLHKEVFLSRSDASKREILIKKMNHKEKRKLINYN